MESITRENCQKHAKSRNIYNNTYIKYRIRIKSHDALNLSLRIALSIAFRHEAHDFFLSSVGNFLNVL